MNFSEKFELKCRGAVEQAEPRGVEGTLLVGDTAIGRWEDHGRASQYGYDDIAIFPAFFKGEKCFFLKKEWVPAPGYTACGIEESVVSLEDGIHMLIERGIYDGYFKE